MSKSKRRFQSNVLRKEATVLKLWDAWSDNITDEKQTNAVLESLKDPENARIWRSTFHFPILMFHKEVCSMKDVNKYGWIRTIHTGGMSSTDDRHAMVPWVEDMITLVVRTAVCRWNPLCVRYLSLKDDTNLLCTKEEIEKLKSEMNKKTFNWMGILKRMCGEYLSLVNDLRKQGYNIKVNNMLIYLVLSSLYVMTSKHDFIGSVVPTSFKFKDKVFMTGMVQKVHAVLQWENRTEADIGNVFYNKRHYLIYRMLAPLGTFHFSRYVRFITSKQQNHRYESADNHDEVEQSQRYIKMSNLDDQIKGQINMFKLSFDEFGQFMQPIYKLLDSPNGRLDFTDYPELFDVSEYLHQLSTLSLFGHLLDNVNSKSGDEHSFVYNYVMLQNDLWLRQSEWKTEHPVIWPEPNGQFTIYFRKQRLFSSKIIEEVIATWLVVLCHETFGLGGKLKNGYYITSWLRGIKTSDDSVMRSNS